MRIRKLKLMIAINKSFFHCIKQSNVSHYFVQYSIPNFLHVDFKNRKRKWNKHVVWKEIEFWVAVHKIIDSCCFHFFSIKSLILVGLSAAVFIYFLVLLFLCFIMQHIFHMHTWIFKIYILRKSKICLKK